MRHQTVLVLTLAWVMGYVLPALAESPQPAPAVKWVTQAKSQKAKTPAKEKVSAVSKDAGPAKEKTAVGIPGDPLGDGFISLGILHITLNRPASITLHNVGGQQLFHLDSFRSSEIFPLHGINAGFLYLTIRSGKNEFTKKLVYTGK